MSKREAFEALEAAFRYWYWETDQDEPDVGILVIGLSRQGVDIQYLGKEPSAVVDWPNLFKLIIQELEAGRYRIDTDSELSFKRRK